jgi:hypothetical protein
MAAPLPQFLVRSFTIANQAQNATDQSVFYGPYIRLLYYLFGFDSDFEIQQQFDDPSTAREPADVVATFTIEHNQHPVMFVQVKAPGTFINNSKRKGADEQIREHFCSLRHRLVTPHIPAVSAFGTRLAFYDYVAATKSVTPPAIPVDHVHSNDVAPAERWNYDVLEDAGLARLRQEIQNAIDMCQRL